MAAFDAGSVCQGKGAKLQSPKFEFLKPDLRETFDSKLLTEEWKKRVRYQIRKQLIFDVLEYRDYSENVFELIESVQAEVLSGTYQVKHSKRYLVEKSRGLCRQMTLVHPRDLLVLERLARSIYFELKKKAPSKSAYFEPDDGDFKKGLEQLDTKYGSFESWRKFQKAVFGFAAENKYIVVTDVANFYDFINFQHLRNIVSSLAKMRESTLDLLIHVLNKLTWTPDFMPLTQVGMPQIETTATRVLANALLYEVDRVCEAAAVENYARFMDDIDVGVSSIPKAKTIVRDIDLTLQARQLRLNSSKTKILNQKDAYDHFCIGENLDLIRVEALVKRGRLRRLLRSIILHKYESWLQREGAGRPGEKSAFRKGNGSKIHKFVLRLIYESGGKVPEEDLIWLIENDPGMRGTAFRYLALSRRNNSNLHALKKIVDSGKLIDDAAFVDLCGFLVHARFRKTAKCVEIVQEICKQMERSGDIGLYCAILVSTRFLRRSSTLLLLRRNAERIRLDFWLSRVAAGAFPRFSGNSRAMDLFIRFIRGLRSDDAERVLGYMIDLSSTSALSASRKAYLEAANPSFPQHLYYPKVLCLLAVANNPNLTSSMSTLYRKHTALRSDPFYRKMGFG